MTDNTEEEKDQGTDSHPLKGKGTCSHLIMEDLTQETETLQLTDLIKVMRRDLAHQGKEVTQGGMTEISPIIGANPMKEGELPKGTEAFLQKGEDTAEETLGLMTE